MEEYFIYTNIDKKKFIVTIMYLREIIKSANNDTEFIIVIIISFFSLINMLHLQTLCRKISGLFNYHWRDYRFSTSNRYKQFELIGTRIAFCIVCVLDRLCR